MKLQQITQPLTMFLLGTTGDLAKKKILKAVYELFRQGLLPRPFSLIGIARKEFTLTEYQNFVYEVIQPKEKDIWKDFVGSLQYVQGDLSDIATFEKIKAVHNALPYCGNHLWYVATLPSLYVDVARFIGQVGLNESPCGWTKIMMEKPFGTDLATAQELNRFLSTIFSEDQIYRIDHFLAKETVQNLLAFRFANGMFEHLWNRMHVDHIQVNAIESIGLAGRGEFYEGVGTTRDVVQNHVLQLIATTLMEEPLSLESQAINGRRNDLLRAMRVADVNHVESIAAFGQYDTYIPDAGLAVTESKTETAVAMQLAIETDRWRGVPIYLRAGKQFAQTATEISIQFKEPQNRMFGALGGQRGNVLTLRIQPNEGVVLHMYVKKPGLKLAIDEVPMSFCYKNAFEMELVEAYVKLIHDAIAGDATLFPDSSGIEEAWRIVEPVLEYKRQPNFRLASYATGSWGPEEFNHLLGRSGRKWIEPSDMFCQI